MKKKSWWEKRKPWEKGGTIGGTAGIVWTIIGYSLIFHEADNLIFRLMSIQTEVICGSLGLDEWGCLGAVVFWIPLYTIIASFLFGALIGFIIGLCTKNRQKQ